MRSTYAETKLEKATEALSTFRTKKNEKVDDKESKVGGKGATDQKKSVLVWWQEIKLQVSVWFFSVHKTFNKFILGNQIAACVVMGMLGFIYAVCVLVYDFGHAGKKGTPKANMISHSSVFGNISIVNKDTLVSNLLTKRQVGLKAIEIGLFEKKKKLDTIPPKSADRTAQGQNALEIKTNATQQAQTTRELYTIGKHNEDSLRVYFLKYLYMDKNGLLNGIKQLNYDHAMSVTVYGAMLDTVPLLKAVPLAYDSKLHLKLSRRGKVLDFISEYPIFGLWMVITIAQMMVWFLIFPLLSANWLNLQQVLGESYQISMTTRLVNFFVPAVFVASFCYAFYSFLADSRLITDNYFITAYNIRMRFYGTIGYFVAIFCFTGYLTLAAQFENLNNELLADAKKKDQPEFIAKISSLKKALDRTFLCSAIVLSLMIFWIANVVNAVNSLEIFTILRHIAGRSLIPSDLVYLMGILHTLLLLVFYIPVRLKFASMDISTEPNSDIPKTIFKSLLTNLSTLLVTTSPMIASLCQNLFDLFLNRPSV